MRKRKNIPNPNPTFFFDFAICPSTERADEELIVYDGSAGERPDMEARTHVQIIHRISISN